MNGRPVLCIFGSSLVQSPASVSVYHLKKAAEYVRLRSFRLNYQCDMDDVFKIKMGLCENRYFVISVAVFL